MEIFGNALADIVNAEVSHPAIVAPLAAGLEEGTPFMAYEYVAGESLDVALRRAARSSAALEWIAALADAVDAAHAGGLVHGALHLRDVLVSSEGVCATGFGIASALEYVRLDIPVRRPYTAPEVMAGRRWGPPADRFAVAVLAYELLTGVRLPGNGDEAIAGLRESCPDVADIAGLQQAFRNALADEPAIRSPSAAAFVAALGRAVGDEALERSPSGVRGREPAAGVGPDVLDAALEAQGGAEVGDVARGDDRAALDAPEYDEPVGSEPPGSGGTTAQAVQFALPGAGADVEGLSVGSASPGGADQDLRSEGRSRREPPSKRRSPRRAGGRRRAGPVVAVRDSLHFDPLDDRSAVESAVEPTDYDGEGEEEVPPPPSPASLRAMAPVIAAIVVGGLLAYLVNTGLRTSGDEVAGGAPEQPAGAGAGVEWSEGTVVESDAQGSPSTAGRSSTLVDETIMPVGDAPLRGADRLPGASPPAPAPPAAIADPPAAGRPPSTAAAPVVPQTPPAERGRMLIRTTPSGALVTLDGRPRGAAPLSIDDVSPGVHRLSVAAPGYVTDEREMTIAPGSPVTAVDIALTPLAAGDAPAAPAGASGVGAGSLLVESRPPGATVRVDDVAVGVTPVAVPDVALGQRQVRIELPGYRPWVAEVDVSGAERVRVGASLEPERRR